LSKKADTAEHLKLCAVGLFIASQEISAAVKQHICDMQFNAVAVELKS